MRWLLKLEIDHDPIVVCRMMNIFRRKGVAIDAMALAARPDGFSCVAVVDSPAAEVDHMFNFLRRTDGVQDVSCYQHEPSLAPAFVFFESGSSPEGLRRALEASPESRIVFAGQGKYLLEVVSEDSLRANVAGLSDSEVLLFACVKTTRRSSPVELVGAASS